MKLIPVERYSDAFKNIAQAVEIIKEEKKIEEEKEEKREKELRKKLGIDPSRFNEVDK